MAINLPTIGDWYFCSIDNTHLEVVAVDEQFGTIEVQYNDGAVSEYDVEGWQQLSAIPSSPPRAGDVFEAGLNPDWGNDMLEQNWINPLQLIGPDTYGDLGEY